MKDMDIEKHIDTLSAAQEAVKASGWEVRNQKCAQTGTFYFEAVKLDDDGYEAYDDDGEIYEIKVRVSTHSNCVDRRRIDINIAPEADTIETLVNAMAEM